MLKQILNIDSITMKFGSLVANENVSFTIHENEIVSLIGPNGAGKTTLFNCITGFYQPFSGKVTYKDKDITGFTAYEICRLGITRTFQIVQTLKEMTVEENIMTGAFLHTKSRKEAERITSEIMELTDLTKKKNVLGGSLTIVDKKRVEIARALATKPQILMLDECMAGLNQTEIKDVMNLCLKLKESGLSLLIVEHIMEAIMPISDNIVVLNAGKKIAEGIPSDIVNNDEVIKAYLGDKYHAKSQKS
ncbi:ABC transporter ATP-binding protein [Sedimentibacter sp.]|uniref:ABC transporter ATP-binding protein n=1 Tax=Sedimentibacter sp. TaxID=1960295 RepID=UPI0028AF53F4|nr:ABC transporter ATP-binding protein [Sedimentibacter sp.]